MKEKKKILIVSRSFYPINSPRSFRTTELVKEFARQGHDVTLLTVKNSEEHLEFEKKHGVIIKDLGPLKFSEIDTSGSNRFSTLYKRVKRRGLYQFFEYPNIELMWKVKRALRNESGYDLLISIAVPHPIHWGVSKVWNKQNKPAQTWIADCGDPYMGAALDTFNKFFYFKYFEKAFCRKTDFITVPIEEAKGGYYPEFRDKIEVIPQGFQFNGLRENPDKKPENKVPTFAYAGSLIPEGRDPRAFLDHLVNNYQDYKCILYTRSTALVEPYVQKSKGKIEIRDYIPRTELLKELSGMDFLLNFENKTSLQLPSKLIDYYLTGRPVLSVGSGEVGEAILKEFMSGSYDKQYPFQNMDQYRIENVCRQFLTLHDNHTISNE